jgi:hypothetical protein
MPGAIEDLYSGRGRRDRPAGPMQQPYAEHALEAEQIPRDGGLGDAELDRGVGERPRVHDRDQAAQLPQLQIHDFSV